MTGINHKHVYVDVSFSVLSWAYSVVNVCKIAALPCSPVYVYLEVSSIIFSKFQEHMHRSAMKVSLKFEKLMCSDFNGTLRYFLRGLSHYNSMLKGTLFFLFPGTYRQPLEPTMILRVQTLMCPPCPLLKM